MSKIALFLWQLLWAIPMGIGLLIAVVSVYMATLGGRKDFAV